MKLFFLFRQ